MKGIFQPETNTEWDLPPSFMDKMGWISGITSHFKNAIFGPCKHHIINELQISLHKHTYATLIEVK